MSNAIITDMSGAYIEHSEIITNFVATVYSQLKGNICRVYPDNVQYKWTIGDEEKIVIPDASIIVLYMLKKGIRFSIFHVLHRGSFLHLRKNMTVRKRWSYTDNRKLMNTGL